MTKTSRPGPLRRLGISLGVLYDEAGTPRGQGRRSRYSARASARLDEDIDDLRARVADLEKRLAGGAS